MSVIESNIYTVATHWLECDPQDLAFSPMETDPSNCLNNSDYKMMYRDKTFFVKYSGSQASPGDRLQNEFACARIASSVGIAPRPLLYDEKHGVLVSGFIQNARYLDFQESGSKERYINLLKKLHCIQQSFPKEFSPFNAIREYFAKAVEMQVALPESLEKFVECCGVSPYM